jgi:hypothetical protein
MGGGGEGSEIGAAPSTNLSLFSRRTGGRLGEEGRGDEGFGGGDPATSYHYDPDRRLTVAFALLPALALITPYPLLSQPPPLAAGREGE